ncbi:MAG: RNB domain-containing ribonuclease, partial [Pseudolabrys sp.]|nr:RNB domain-containing ribonuclease [Pseudolabrys sp.]
MAKPRNPHPRPLPSKEEVLEFIGSRSGKVGRREIARAFAVAPADRAALTALLHELNEDGTVERRRKKLHRAGHLPSTVLADVSGRDADGELIAEPTEWDEEAHGAAPKIRVPVPRRARPGEAAGVGDHVLLRVEETGAADDGIRHSGRVIKVIDRAKHRIIGVYRSLGDGSARLVPVDKKALGRELTIVPGTTAGARDGDLVAAEVSRPRGYGPPQARVKERLGSLKSERAVSLIAIHAHGLPHEFSRGVLAEADEARAATLAGREDWRQLPLVTIDPADAKDHDDAVHAAPDPDRNNPGGHIVTVAIADVAFYVRPGTALDHAALERGN